MNISLFIRAMQLGLLTALLWGCGSTQIKDDGRSQLKKSGLYNLTEQQLEHYKNALHSLKSEKPKIAEKTLSKLLSAKPRVAEIRLNLALSQYQQQKYAPAQQTLDKLLQIDPSIAQGYNLKGLIAVHNGHFSKAAKHYETAIELNPKYDKAFYNMALLQDVYLQDIALAISYYQKYLQLQTDDEQTKDWVAHLKSSLKD